MTLARRLMVLALGLALVGTMVGCKNQTESPALTPKVAPPVIASTGVLKAGVDLTYPPFAGTDKGVKAGIDVDVAAAIAEKLGLKLELVSVDATGMAAALNGSKVDIMLGATPITDAVLANVSSAGSYMMDGPAIFSKAAEGSEVATVNAADLPGKRVAVQEQSASFWKLEYDYGTGFASAYPSLKEALKALADGEVDYVVGDAAVGAYIAHDYPGIAFAGQYGAAQPLGVAVKKDAPDLETAVRDALDALSADRTLDAISMRWLGNMPKLKASA